MARDLPFRLRAMKHAYLQTIPDASGLRAMVPSQNVLRRFVAWDAAEDPAGAALAAMLKEMRDEVPRIPLETPLAPGAGPAAIAMIARLELILELCGEVNAVLHDATETEFPRSWREGTQNVLFDVMYAVDLLWQSLAAEDGEFTMAGKFLRAVLDGYDPGKLSFSTAKRDGG